MAKFAGELKKPDAMIILRPEDIPGKVKDVPVKELCGIGMKLEEYLAELNVRTLGSLMLIRGKTCKAVRTGLRRTPVAHGPGDRSFACNALLV